MEMSNNLRYTEVLYQVFVERYLVILPFSLSYYEYVPIITITTMFLYCYNVIIKESMIYFHKTKYFSTSKFVIFFFFGGDMHLQVLDSLRLPAKTPPARSPGTS
jgi:hypothetical protein